MVRVTIEILPFGKEEHAYQPVPPLTIWNTGEQDWAGQFTVLSKYGHRWGDAKEGTPVWHNRDNGIVSLVAKVLRRIDVNSR